jgi:hypothetical protein
MNALDRVMTAALIVLALLGAGSAVYAYAGLGAWPTNGGW